MSASDSNVNVDLAGTYIASPTSYMVYGKGSISKLAELVTNLGGSKALIVTGTTLDEKTPIIKVVREALGEKYSSTFSKIKQHAPISDILQAVDTAKKSGADIIVSVGGGSPIDAGKAITYFMHQETGRWMSNIAVPTTLSGAETTQIAGYTGDDGMKTGIVEPKIVPGAIIYDGELAAHTPARLWATSGFRALDHAIELLYHPTAPEVPSKRLALIAIADLFTHLPRSTSTSTTNEDSADTRQNLFLASYSALFPHLFHGPVLFTGGTGISHSLGNVLGATYHIPHGLTSCLTLAAVVRLKAATKPDDARHIARAVEAVGNTRTGDATVDAKGVGDAIDDLVTRMGFKTSLTECGVPPGQEEIITERALPGGREHPDFEAVASMVRNLY